MTHAFEEVVRNESALNKIAHRLAISDYRAELSDSLLERLNIVMQSNRWFAAGEFIPLERGQVSDYSFYFNQLMELTSCHFQRLWLDTQQEVVAVAEVSSPNHIAIVDAQELCTSNGIPFEQLFSQQLNDHNASELPAYFWRKSN